MEDPANPVRINEKWIVIIIWSALLYLLYLTTANGSVVGFAGNIRNFYLTFFPSNVGFNSNFPIGPNVIITAIGMMILTVVLVFQLFKAWTRFIELTNQLLIALVQSSLPGERNPILFELLNFRKIHKKESPVENQNSSQQHAGEVTTTEDEEAKNEVIETDPDEAIGSIIGDVLKALAISWAIIIR